MTVKITKDKINIREKLSQLDKPTGLTGEALLRSNTAENARETLNLEEHLFETFESTGIDDNATSTAITIDSSGNVGVGTSFPDHTLRVSGDARLGNLHLKTSDFGAGGTGKTIYADAAGAGLLGFISTTAFDFSNGSTSRLRIDSAGNVGIGTTNPGHALDIIGGKIQVNEGGATWFGSDATGGYVRTFNGNTFRFLSSNSSESMRIDSSGRLLIGRTASVSNANAEDMQIGNTSGAHGLTILSQNTHNGNIFFGDNDNNDAGSISYNHTNDRLEFHTNRSQKMTIASNGNVGIGITSPTRTLEVRASSSSMVSQFKSVSGDNAFICFANNSSTADQVRIGSTGSSLVLSTAFTERMRIDSSGNVGIGTTSPAVALDIIAPNGQQFRIRNTEADATLKNAYYSVGHYTNAEQDFIWALPQSSGGSNTLYLGGGTSIGNAATNIIFHTAGNATTTTGTERLRIDSSGNVGIGTPSPTSKLEVVSASTNANALGVTIRNTSSTSDPEFELGVGYPGYYDNSALIRHNNNLTAYITSAGDWQHLKLFSMASNTAIQSMVNGNAQINLYDVNGDLRLSSNANTIFRKASSEYMRIDSSGNVGIGTSSPGYKLDVDGTARFYDSGGSSTTYTFEANHYASLEIIGDKDASASGPYSNKLVTHGTNGQLQFRAADVTYMVMDQSGKVGIGTTSPSSLLHLYGGAATLTLESVTNTAVIDLENTSTTGQIQLANDYLTTAVGGTERMRIASNGNVGIGLTSPSTKLHVDGDIRAENGRFLATRGTAAAPAYRFHDDGDTGMFNLATDILGFATGGSEAMRIDINGNIGMGTGTPSTKLEVVGTVTSSNVTTQNYDVESDFAAIYALLGDVNSALDAINGEVV